MLRKKSSNKNLQNKCVKKNITQFCLNMCAILLYKIYLKKKLKKINKKKYTQICLNMSAIYL